MIHPLWLFCGLLVAVGGAGVVSGGFGSVGSSVGVFAAATAVSPEAGFNSPDAEMDEDCPACKSTPAAPSDVMTLTLPSKQAMLAAPGTEPSILVVVCTS